MHTHTHTHSSCCKSSSGWACRVVLIKVVEMTISSGKHIIITGYEQPATLVSLAVVQVNVLVHRIHREIEVGLLSYVGGVPSLLFLDSFSTRKYRQLIAHSFEGRLNTSTRRPEKPPNTKKKSSSIS